MSAHYIKAAFRTIQKYKSFSLINVVGLALGIACSVLILLWIQDEMSWDRFHENSENIYRVVQEQRDGHYTPVTPDALAVHLKSEYPEVKDAARYKKFYKIHLKYRDSSFAEAPLIADPAFFRIFSFPFLKGRAQTALENPNSIVITEQVSDKLFGSEEPIGRTVVVNDRTSLEVTGVIENVPRNSSFDFSCVLPFHLIAQGRSDNNWSSNSTWTYIQLQSDASELDVNRKIAHLASERDSQNNARLKLQPLTQIHLSPQGQGGPVIHIYIFSAMAVFVLIIACINFINLTTARSSLRAKEVGLRKVIGASRANLVRQFFGESILFTLAAVLAAALIVALFLPAFNSMADKDFSFIRDVLLNRFLLLSSLGLIGFASFFSGSYPALLISSYQPVKVLGASKTNIHTGRSPLLRRVLVVIQYALAIFLMIGTFVIYKQLNFIQNRDLGFNQEFVVCSDSPWGDREQSQIIKEELLKNQSIQSITFTSQRMGEWESGAREDVIWQGKVGNPELTFEVIFCDPDFLETHKMELAQGRFFSWDMKTDEGQSFVLNEAAVKVMAFNGESPLGKSLSFWDSYQGTIIGVIKDFHTQSLHHSIKPVILAFDSGSLDIINIRIQPDNVSGAIKFLEAKWKELTPDFNFEYWFMDESLDLRYRTEQATGTILKYFTGLAIFIACIGLIGLVSFLAQQRTKEIGIRKVLGASVPKLLRLLVREFVALVLLANLIAWPAAYFILRMWLENFAYRTHLELSVFLLAGGAALTIALAAISWQALKTAKADPVESLRYE